MLYSFSNLPPEQLGKLQAVESEIGGSLLAFTEVTAEPVRLDREKLAKIRDLEEDLGVVLVAISA